MEEEELNTSVGLHHPETRKLKDAAQTAQKNTLKMSRIWCLVASYVPLRLP